MMKGILLAVSVALTAGASQTLPRPAVTIRHLTVPVERLPIGCALAPEPSRIRFGMSAGSSANPWITTDREGIISIRDGLDIPRAFPDGPPPDAKALTRYRAQLANEVEEAYGAVYMQSDAEPVAVRAIRFAHGVQASARDIRVSTNPKVIRVEIGSIVAVVSGNGDCFQTVGAYLKSLAN